MLECGRPILAAVRRKYNNERLRDLFERGTELAALHLCPGISTRRPSKRTRATRPSTRTRLGPDANGNEGGAKQPPTRTRPRDGKPVVSSTPDENRRRLRALMSGVKWAAVESDPLSEAYAAFQAVAADCRVLCDAIVDFERRGYGSDSESEKGSTSPSKDNNATNPGSSAFLELEYGTVQSAWSHIDKLLNFRETEPADEEAAAQKLSRQSTGVRSELSIEEPPKPLADFAGAVADEATLRAPDRPDDSLPRQRAPKAERPITERYDISTRGDTILEFPVIPGEGTPVAGSLPRRRRASFRVSSHILSEVSPVFAQLFSKTSLGGRRRDEDFQGPYPRARGEFNMDGLQVKVYRMPPLNPREISPLEILLHAAHMHNAQVPRAIDFERFVTIAELCYRLQCTSPLEVFVEMRWLPDWVHMGTEAMPDGLLLISYVFGSRGLFTRMTKSAILNVVGEEELSDKPWPKELKDKLWAVRSAKMEQVHECDAANLGYLMMVMSEMQLLPIIMNPAVLSHLSEPGSGAALALPRRSLAQLVRMLQTIPGPPNPVHKGVCDPIPAFRASVIDIYNSLSGLTLFDVTGKHGYVLSREYATTPQSGFFRPPLSAEAPSATLPLVGAHSIPEGVMLGLLRQLSVVHDISALAMANKSFYATYKKYECTLRGGAPNHLATASATAAVHRATVSVDNGTLDGDDDDDSDLGPSVPLEQILTEEEARRILWPEAPPRSPPPSAAPADRRSTTPVLVTTPPEGCRPRGLEGEV
ncbi:unnamed protein product [Parascedosporium putredinis]|uniref:BTB domain-containing protein n=1 Tax=Parascedosporium putredinis TaxID=1442378 RepID=A0A9P1M7A2_9PEZI|nr:unnamed protein product [Parascedosporium putredinis]CAI7988152.1 unnamed protein product [Parascedosporium putredinis]